MASASKRRWFQCSLRSILFWHVPFAAVLALIVTWPHEPAPAADSGFGNVMFYNIGDAIVTRMQIYAGILLVVIWFAAPPIANLVRRTWRNRGNTSAVQC